MLVSEQLSSIMALHIVVLVRGVVLRIKQRYVRAVLCAQYSVRTLSLPDSRGLCYGAV